MTDLTNKKSLYLCALAMTASAAVLGQDGAGSSAASSASQPPTETAVREKSRFRFEGTDLLLGDLPPISFHGFASQGFLASTDYDYLGQTTDTSLQFNEFGLNASMSPFQRTRIAAQAFTFDLGHVGNHELMLDYALIDYSFNDKIGVRAGRVRRPMGLYNHIQDIDLARTFVLLPQGVYDSRWRDFSASIDGGSVYGNIGMGRAGELSYEGYTGLINLSQQGGLARLFQNSLPPAPIGGFDSVEGSLLAGGQLWWSTPLPGLRAGATAGKSFGLESHYLVRPPFGPGAMTDSLDTTYQQYSLEYTVKSWTFQAEYKSLNTSSETTASGMVVGQSRSRSDAWYASAAYRFNNWLEVGTYYSEFYGDVNNRNGAGRAVPSDANQKDVALAFRFDPKPWWVLKLEGHWMNGTALLRDNGSNPTRTGDDWFMLAAKTTFSF